ncbi:hypothetical protein [Halostella salina]|uniref:hypothetical protein n=1 Tax=Halostella salina TaxID=1547897 RepID=UPI0013CE9FA3|nr:hypothetical protein [Halostella salina]
MPANDKTVEEGRTRRRWLAGLGACVASGFAGCSSGDGDDGDSNDVIDSGPANDSTGDNTDVGTASNDSGAGCPTDFNYVTQEYSAFGQTGYLGQCEIPESARTRGRGEGVSGNGFTAIFEWESGGLTSFDVGAQFDADPEQEGLEEPTVDGEVAFLLENSSANLSRATEQYENIPDGGVVLVSERTAGDDSAIPLVTNIVFEHPDGVMSVAITLNETIACQAASEKIYRRLAESQEPV